MAAQTSTSSTDNRLPAAVLEAMSSMQWDLSNLPPMFFEGLEQMAQRRANDNDLAIACDVLGTVAALKQNAASSASLDASNDNDDNNLEYTARIATALLLLGNGYTDEAHDLVLSLSWRGELPYAYGPPVHVENEQLQAAACYTHCLVHRREGPHPSEFDMKGFENSNYWAGHTMRILVVASDFLLPLHAMEEAVRRQADNNNYALEWIQEHVQPHFWDPRQLTELCREVHSCRASSQQQTQHPLKEFAERCALLELRILLEHILFDMMGFSRE